MAYSAAVTYQTSFVAGVRHVVATIVETGVTLSTHEYEVEVPLGGTMHLHICTLTAGDGSATTVDPDIFEVTGTTATARRVWQNGAAAASARSTPTDAHFYTANGKLYCHSTANGTTGTTGNITTIMHFSSSFST